MSRNVTTLEKGIILAIIVAAILGSGGYFLAWPEYQKIEIVDNQIRQRIADIQKAEALKVVVMGIGDIFQRNRVRAESVHERFYGEMTPPEAITEVQRLLSDFGVPPASGISVTDVGETTLSLQVFTGGRDVRYQLRELAFLFGGPPITDEDKDTEEKSPGEIITTHLFGEEPNLEDPDIQNKIDAIFESRALLIKEMVEVLKTDTLSAEDRALFVDTVRNLLVMEKASPGVITATFSLEMTYAQYLDFLDYINNLPQITLISSATLWQNVAEAGNDLRGYSFTLSLCVMKPLYVRDIRPNPFAPLTMEIEETTQEDGT